MLIRPPRTLHPLPSGLGSALPMRTSLIPIAACAALFLALVSCDSPGEAYRYRDLKIQPGASATPAVPGANATVTIAFGVFNTDLQPMAPVEWQAVMDGNPTPIASGTIAVLEAQRWVYPSFTTTPGPGSHTYLITLDPNRLIVDDRDASNNLQSFTLVFADLNLSHATVPTVAPTIPTIADPLTFTATIRNTDTAGVLATAHDVVVVVREDDADLASTTIASIAPAATATVAIPLPAATAGTHTYTVVIDPGAAITVRDRALTTATVTVTVLVTAPG